MIMLQYFANQITQAKNEVSSLDTNCVNDVGNNFESATKNFLGTPAK